MTSGDFYILIDTGGTNCRIAASFDSLNIVSPIVYSSVHFSRTGLAGFTGHLSGLINLYLSENGFSKEKCRGVCIGAAGARSLTQKSDISEEISEKTGISNVVTESDAAIAYESYYGTGDGLLLICGTGSVLFGKYRGEDVRIGGWGRLLGDAGSSYSFSINLLRSLVKEIDRNENISELEKMLEEKHGISRHTIINEIYHGDFDIASLAPSLLKMAEEGNGLCRMAAEEETEGISGMADIFISRYNPAEKVDLAFTGSLVETKNYFSGRLFALLGSKYGNRFNLINNFRNPLEGALKIAVRRIA